MKLKELYTKEVIPQMKKKFGYKNVNSVPKLSKVVLNVGFGRHAKDKKFIASVKENLTRITGQNPIMTKAKKSVSSFKVREGMIIGSMVTLRGARMYDFVEKLINVTFPRVRDFRGITIKSIDNKGNITIGFKEHISFPEIRADEVDNVHGLEVCIETNAGSKEEGEELFKLLGFPFKKEE